MDGHKINILIADDNIEFCNVFNEFLSNQNDIIVVGIAGNGVESLKLIDEKRPDLVILDIIMPNLDGIGVLEALNSMNIQPMPRVIALSAIGKDFITQKVLALGADYYVMKPFNMEDFVKRIRQMFNITLSIDDIKIANSPSSIEMYVTDIIHEIGVPVHIRGYIFLREAIIMVVNNIELISAFTKELYPSIALKFNTTASRVERSIRHAIELAYSSSEIETINKLFDFTIRNGRWKPTNRDFISRIAHKIRLDNKMEI